MDGESAITWQPPKYDTSRQPELLHVSQLSPDAKFTQNFARTVKWCPDGSLALAHCENRSFQYLDLPPELLDLTFAQTPFEGPKKRVIPQADPILDFIWYPHATPRDPASFCFVASVRERPVRLLDASDGRLRASYKIVDHRERQIAPHSLAFNPTAQKLYCGFEDAIEVFDLSQPGEGTRLATTPSRKSRDGLKGIISALAFCPSYDPSYSLFAAGSLSPSSTASSNIALFSEDTGGKPVGWVGDVRASVMQIAFNPMKPHVLYASFRRHDEIYAWDIRGDTIVPIQVFRKKDAAHSRTHTNQKIRFDVDIAGKWMGVGDEDGDISIFDLEDGSVAEEPPESYEVSERASVLKYHAHDDAIGSVAFHPLNSLLLSASGSRHFVLGDDESRVSEQHASDSASSGASSEDEEDGAEVIRRRLERRQPSVQDSSIKLWKF